MPAHPAHAGATAQTALAAAPKHRAPWILVRRLAHRLLHLGRSTLVAIGLAGLLLCAGGYWAWGQSDLRHQLEQDAMSWLQARLDARLGAQDEASRVQAAAKASSLRALPTDQARLAKWISGRYQVAGEPVAELVTEAWALGRQTKLDPTLILAIAAIESRFNPFAQSHAGAQGLMQVLTRVHDDKFESFGGVQAAFDPIANLRVGVLVLRESIRRGGSLGEGLRHYSGAALLAHDGGYISKVMSEQNYMRDVLAGRRVSFTANHQITPLARPAPPAIETGPATAPDAVSAGVATALATTGE